MEKDKHHSGELYDPNDGTIMSEQFACLDRLFRFNQLPPSRTKERFAMLREMFAEVGAGVIVLPGVTIGDNTVVGAGSVVTRDLPANVVAVGNPCRVLRPLGEKDKKYYFRNHQIDPRFFE